MLSAPMGPRDWPIPFYVSKKQKGHCGSGPSPELLAKNLFSLSDGSAGFSDEMFLLRAASSSLRCPGPSPSPNFLSNSVQRLVRLQGGEEGYV